MGLVKEAYKSLLGNRFSVPKDNSPDEEKVPSPSSLEVEENISSSVRSLFKKAGFDCVKPLQKVAELASEVPKMKEAFQKKATDAIISEVAGRIYQDPLLARIVDAGDLGTALRLAEGRYSDHQTINKLASLSVEEFQKLAASNLKSKLINQIEAPEHGPEKSTADSNLVPRPEIGSKTTEAVFKASKIGKPVLIGTNGGKVYYAQPTGEITYKEVVPDRESDLRKVSSSGLSLVDSLMAKLRSSSPLISTYKN